MALGGRPMADWIAEYARSHRHPVNRACHTVGIPTVTLGILLLLLSIALKMIFPHPEGASGHRVHGEPFLVPLAIPFIAGPSAIATVLLLVSRESGWVWEWIGALAVAMAVSAVV